MRVSELSSIILALLAGLLLGMVFYGGLWWTIRKGISSSLPGLWFSGSLLLRSGIVVTGFYFVLRSGWPALLACLAGFVAARIAVHQFTQVPSRLEEGSS
jgi:F1F0 ATPase subunit 2